MSRFIKDKKNIAIEFYSRGNDQTMKKETMTREGKTSLFWGFILLAVLLGLDQLTKYLAYNTLRLHGSLRLLPGVFELQYLENRGAAFGMLENMQWIFVLFALVITAAAGWFYLRLSAGRFTCPRSFVPLKGICILLMAGALGNMIDRLIHGFVIDFLYFSLIDFPVFNVADIYVCVGTVCFLLVILFYYKEEDLAQIQGKKTQQDYMKDLIHKIHESRNEEKRNF